MIVCVCNRISDREITRQARAGMSFDDIQLELGVARMLRLLRDELEMAMALTGCRTLAEAGAHLLDPATAAVWEQAGPR